MKWMRWPRLLVAGLVFLGACQVQDRVAGGSSDETRTTVSVHGRVLDEQARGIEAVTVRLSQQGVEVVTDSNGAYAIPSSALDSARPDTLLFFHDGQQVSSMPVQAAWTQIPDLILFQREIAGVLGCIDAMPASATAFFLWNAREIDSVPLVLDTVQDRFSTFVWVGVTDTAEPFGVYVDFRDSAGRPVSRSPVQRFQRLPDEIVVGEFGCYNSIPTLALTAPDSAYRGDMILVRSGAASTIGLPLSLEWSIDSGKEWVPGPLDTVLQVPPRHPGKTWRILTRVTDSRGKTTFGMAEVGLKYRPPVVSLEVDSFVEINGGYPVHLRFQQDPNEEPMECRLRDGIPHIVSDSILDPLTRTANDIAGPMRSQDEFWRSTLTDRFLCKDTIVRIPATVVGLNRVELVGRNVTGHKITARKDNYLYPRKPDLMIKRDSAGGIEIAADYCDLPSREGGQSSYELDLFLGLSGLGRNSWHYLPGWGSGCQHTYHLEFPDSILQGGKDRILQVRGVFRVRGEFISNVVFSDTAHAELVIP